MKFELIDGLLFASIKLTFNGVSKVIERVAIDTGASTTILSSDAVADIGIMAKSDDKIVITHGVGGMDYSFRKSIECVEFGDLFFNEVSLDFGQLSENWDINGLIGLDILMNGQFVIDLERMEIYHRN